MAKTNTKNKKSAHPPYLEMITDAITTLKERKGSTQTSIATFIEEKHKKSLPPNFNNLLSIQLNKFVKSEKLLKVINCYTISSTSTKETTTHETTTVAKTKRLSQLKTPEALKKVTTTTAQKKSAVVKVKRLNQVMTPEGMKKKKPNLTPAKRKSTPKQVNSTGPTKKARK